MISGEILGVGSGDSIDKLGLELDNWICCCNEEKRTAESAAAEAGEQKRYWRVRTKDMCGDEIMIKMRLFLALSLMVVMGNMSVAALDDVGGRRYQPGQANEPKEVFFLFYVMDIHNIDAENQNFAINVYVRLRWQDERLKHTGPAARSALLNEVWNPRLLLYNQQGFVRTSLPEVVEIEPDGTVKYRQRYVGTLSQPLNFSKFPRDTQTFTLQFTAAGHASEPITFVPETYISPDSRSKPISGAFMAERLSLPDWKVLTYSAQTQSVKIVDDLDMPGFAFSFTARRLFRYYFWQMIFPQILIVMMSWAAFWIDPSMSGTQISLGVSSMLTLIAHRFLLASQLPRLPYMTQMDRFVLIGTILVFAAFAEVVITSGLVHTNRKELGKSIDRWARLVFPVTFLLGTAISFWA